MHRHLLRSTFVLAAVLALVGAFAVARPILGTDAQEGTADLATHPVVGAWL